MTIRPTECSVAGQRLCLQQNRQGNQVMSVDLRSVSLDVLDHASLLLSTVKEINFNGSRIPSIRDLGSSVRHVEILHIARCDLANFDGLVGFSGLRELYASFNRLANLPVLMATNLRVLDLEGNRIASVAEIKKLQVCDKLEYLHLGYNPVTAIRNYRATLLTALPSLTQLDDADVTLDERSSAYAQCAVIIPTGEADSLKAEHLLTSDYLIEIVRNFHCPISHSSSHESVAPEYDACNLQKRAQETKNNGGFSDLTLRQSSFLCGNPVLALRTIRKTQIMNNTNSSD